MGGLRALRTASPAYFFSSSSSSSSAPGADRCPARELGYSSRVNLEQYFYGLERVPAVPCRAVPARPALHTVPAWAQFYGRVLHNMACVRAAAAAAALLVALRPTLAYTARSLRGHP